MAATSLPPGLAIDDPDGTILRDVQGNILRGYHVPYVRHLVVRVGDARAARAFLAEVVSGSSAGPQLTTAAPWPDDTPKPTCLNLGLTATGLTALGLPDAWLATFPDAFRQGAAARAGKVGDVETSAPDRWSDGLDDPDRVHAMWTIHADGDAALDAVTTELENGWRRSRAFHVTARFDGRTFDTYTGVAADRDTVHFGYRDSISQPRFWVDGQPVGRSDAQPIAPIGAVLLGRVGPDGPDTHPGQQYRTTFPGVAWRMPEARRGETVIQIGVNACFNAFRVIEQDVEGFERFLATSAAAIRAELDRRRHAGEPAGPEGIVWDEERVAAKLMGRWRNGVPMSRTDFAGPGLPPPMDDALLNDFDYPDDVDALDDADGVHCPLGAHIRRANPRGSQIVQRSANYTRPLVRRGVPYGPPRDPQRPGDGIRRGLLGNFMCADLAAQFEAVMYDWINLGLQDPRITATNDPIVGANHPATSRFVIPLDGAAPLVLDGMPRFTRTAGSIYLFCPSVTTIRFLAEPATR